MGINIFLFEPIFIENKTTFTQERIDAHRGAYVTFTFVPKFKFLSFSILASKKVKYSKLWFR